MLAYDKWLATQILSGFRGCTGRLQCFYKKIAIPREEVNLDDRITVLHENTLTHKQVVVIIIVIM